MNSLARTNQDKQNGGTIQREWFLCCSVLKKNPFKMEMQDPHVNFQSKI